MEKGQSSVNGAGKTGYPHAKEWNGVESRWRCGKTQSSHLPTTRVPAGRRWGTSTPKETEEPPSELVGRQGTEWGEVEARQDQRPWGAAEKGEGFPHLEGPSGARIGGSTPSISPAQLAREVCLTLRPGPTPSEDPCRPRWPRGCRGRTGEAGGRGPPGPAGVCPTHSSPGSLLGSQVGSPALWDRRQEGRLGPLCWA